MNDILVSVIIPAYNCGKYISKTIESVLAQDVSLEILIINDCSPEPIDEIIEKYCVLDNVFYIKNEKNLGVAETRNKGVKLARGEYVAFLDSDDYWCENKLRKQLDAIKKTKTVLCATARELILPNGEETGRVIPVKPEITYKDLLKQNPINCSSVLIKREVALEFPMHHADSHEDYIMWLEILQKYGRACAVNEPLLKYRLSTTGKSGNKLHSAKMTFKVYRYMGFGLAKSVVCFASYAFNGVKKYLHKA